MLAAGALYGAAAFTPMVRKAFGQASMGDIDILNFALTLEYLEAAFYEGAAKTPGLSKEVSQYVKTFGAEEQEHVDALTTTIKDLGGTPVEAPKADFGDAFSSVDTLIPLAITFEDTGVSAYNGAAPEIESKDLLATAGGIVQVEARHAAAIRFAAGEDPAPEAFDPVLTEDEVLKAVQPFIQS
jgi:rubrerythrin